MANFKDMLVYYRKRDGLSQRELANKIGVSASTIGMYESGKRFPEREIEETLADVFNVSLNALRGIDEDEVPLYNPRIQDFVDILPKLTDEQIDSLLHTAQLFVSMNGGQ